MALRQAKASCGTIIWIDEKTQVGDSVQGPNGGWWLVRELLDVWTDGGVHKVSEPPAVEETETIPAMELEINDEFIIDNGWARVTGLNNWQGRFYIYVDCISLVTGRKMPSQKVPKTSKIKIKSRKFMETLNVQLAHEQASTVVNKLNQYGSILSMPADKNGKVSCGTSIRIDKTVLVGTARAELKAEANKLAELLKKL